MLRCGGLTRAVAARRRRPLLLLLLLPLVRERRAAAAAAAVPPSRAKHKRRRRARCCSGCAADLLLQFHTAAGAAEFAGWRAFRALTLLLETLSERAASSNRQESKRTLAFSRAKAARQQAIASERRTQSEHIGQATARAPLFATVDFRKQRKPKLQTYQSLSNRKQRRARRRLPQASATIAASAAKSTARCRAKVPCSQPASD